MIYREGIKDVDDLFVQLEKDHILMRIDEKRRPTVYKCATVSSEELITLRKIKNIVRRGRIETIQKDRIIFKDKRFVLRRFYQIITS